MATLGRDSSLNLIWEPVPTVPKAAAFDGPEAAPIDGGVSGCACPDCRGPMTIRLWLMTADCWQCGASVELTLEQERELLRHLERAAPAPSAPLPQRAAAPPPAPAPTRRDDRSAVAPPPPPLPPPPPPAQTPQVEWAPTHELRLRDVTAWLVSAVLHLVLILLLGMWTLSEDPHEPELVLSASVSGKWHRTGGEPSEVEFNTTDFDLPIDKKPKNQKERQVLLKANQAARELRIEPGAPQLQMPSLARVKADLKSTDPYRRMQAARDPRVRAEIVQREGGTTLTEAAVSRGLRWMAAHQGPEGAWSLDRFHQHGDCNGKCGGHGQMQSDSAATAMVLMAMLGTGQTPKVGIYKNSVKYGLAWLVRQQKPDGDLRGNSNGNSGMYAHGLATIALCDAFKMTGDESLRGPAQRAVDFICAAQHAEGGWRYSPGEAGDTSVVGWQLMALHSARSAYLRVPQKNLDRAAQFLDSMQQDGEGASYSYMRGRGPSPTMSGVGLLSRMYLGWDRSELGLELGVDVLSTEFPPRVREPNIYYWYYATQVMHHWGGDPWDRWNRHLREALVTTQIQDGHEAGSWPPQLDPHGAQGGRLYTTALATATLEVYYRYAPLYQQLDLD